jgi:hypothetical protein
MPRYYVNRNPQNNGDHEVHMEGCVHLPSQENRQYLGEFASCSYAVMEAKRFYPQLNGCFYCAKECHTG